MNNPDPENILETLSKEENVYSSCIHQYKLEVDGIQRNETWRVVDGFFTDPKGEVIDACRRMLENEEKALPYAGVAWPLNFEQLPEGRIFCFLPVPLQTSLSAQINGYFDLDDSRQNMFLDDKTSGGDHRRFEWNKALLENSVAQAYVQLIEDLRFDLDVDINAYYSAFPKVSDAKWESWLTSAFYKSAAYAELFKCSGSRTWLKLSDVRSLPPNLVSVGNALIAENFLPIPNPDLPRHVNDGFVRNGIELPKLKPHELRTQLKLQHDVDCPIAEAPRECLRQQEYVVQILRFCLSDKFEEGVNGLPLVIDCRNHLRTIGMALLLLQGTEWDRDVFWDRSHWFIDPEFAKEAQLSSMAKANLLYMDNRLFVSRLAKYVSAQSANEKIKLNEGKEGSLTDTWLIAVFKRLLENSLNGLGEELNKIPLIPDQARILHSMGSSATPLLFRGSQELRRALTEIDVPLVSGVSDELRALLDKFSGKYDCIWPVTPRDLIDTLADQRREALRAYNSFTEVQHALLDYLSKDSSLTELKRHQDRHRKLKSLKIFPTAKGGLVDLSGTTYVSQDFTFPPIEFNVVFLDDGKEHQWRKLYILLEVPELSRSRLIREFLLPCFSEFNDEQKIKASEWLRDHLSIAQNECKDLFEEVRNARIITCEDGELRAPQNVYQPGSKLAKNVLGDQAAFPDMEATYAGESNKRWQEFFRQLDMPTEPQLKDVVDYVKILVADIPDKNQIQSIQTVYEFIKGRVEKDLHEDNKISGELSVALNKLGSISWIPIRQKAGDFLCFAIPEQVYARPGEVYFPSLGQLIASQAYIADLKPAPKKKIREAMRFPVEVPLNLVVAHFREVLAVCSSPDTMPEEKILDKTLKKIYSFFGGRLPKDMDDSDGDTEDRDTEENVVNLAAEFGEIECLWDQKRKCFRRPDHVFTENVKYMEPWRCTINNEDNAIDRGYTALGRKQKPTLDDRMDVLKEIADSGLPIQEPKIAKVIGKVIRHIVESLDEADDSNGEVLVPTRDGRMLEAQYVFMADAPWYDSMLDSWEIPILSSSVSGIPGIQRTLGIHSLANSIDERLTEEPADSDLENEYLECVRLEELLRSPEFNLGLWRLLRHEGHEVSKESLSYLSDIHVQCVKAIQVCLYLHTDEGERLLGDAEADFYWEHDSHQALLVEKRLRYFCDDLAELLNRSLAPDYSLQNLSQLVKILQCEPTEISTILDELKVRNFQDNQEEFAEDEDDEAYQDFPEDTEEEFDDAIQPDEVANDHTSDDAESERDGLEDDTTPPHPGDETEEPDSQDNEEFDDDMSDDTDDDDFTSDESDMNESGQKPWPGGGSTATSPKGRSGSKHSSGKLPRIGEPRKSGSRERPPLGGGAAGNNEDMEKGDSSGDKAPRPPSTSDRNQSAAQRRLVSYVSHGRDSDDRDSSSSGSGNTSMKIGDQAVKIVIEDEQKNGRTARPMAHANEGYDVISEGNNAVRYIEVKGIKAAWGERGITMSAKQFFYGQKHPGRDHWLYVVENVLSQNPLIHKIQNPSEQVTAFAFDGGWRQIAQSHQIAEEKPLPSSGDEVLEDDQVVGIVESIIEAGKFPLVIYRDSEGKEQKKLLKQLIIRKRTA